MSEVSLQFVLEKSIESLTKIAELIGIVNRESTRADGLEDDIRLVSKDLAETEVRLQAAIDGGLRQLRDDLAAEATQAAQDKIAARTDRAALINGLIHGVVGAAAGVLFTVLSSWVAKSFFSAIHPH